MRRLFAINQHHVRSRLARATAPAPWHVSTDCILKKKACSGQGGAISSRCACCGVDWRYTRCERRSTDGPIAAQTDDQAEVDDEDDAVSALTPYGSDAGVVTNSASTTTQYLPTPPVKPPQSSRSDLWMPIWLSRSVLVAFAITFLLMLLTTALLYHFSELGNGISTQREANHYGWKYGPTAGKARTS